MTAITTPDNTEQAERLVISWVVQETPAPRHLRDLVRDYRILDMRVQQASQAEEAPLVDQQNAIYDRLTAAALAKIEISAQADAQLRRIQKREQERPLRELRKIEADPTLSYTERCSRLLALHAQGVRA